jgi:hypothetical protein
MDEQELNLNNLINQYLESLTEREKIVLKIAQEHLESSFSIELSVGFSDWLKKSNIKI